MRDREERAGAAGIVLAGGRGERLGMGRPKAWLETPLGAPLLQVATAIVSRVCTWILVVAPREVALPLPLPAPSVYADDEDDPSFSLERIFDLAPDEGPLAGLVPALERAVVLGADRAWILAVDMPPFTQDELERLPAALAGHPDAVAVVPRTARGLEPMLSWVRPAQVAPVFRQAWDAGERAVHRAFEALGPGRLVELDAGDPGAWPGGPARLQSINTAEDLARVYGAERP
jgi:molybdopterin-guanine dinucleotide biosynthesis protein A